MNALGDAMPAELRVQVSEMQSEMEVCTKVLRQHMEDSMRTNSDVSSQFLPWLVSLLRLYCLTQQE